eukprot:SAG11_NODE_32929_length_280_cov_0.569061_1_plen_26_part_10
MNFGHREDLVTLFWHYDGIIMTPSDT